MRTIGDEHPVGEAGEIKAKKKRKRKEDDPDAPIIGVDGEGHDTPDGDHIYTYLAAVDETGKLVADAYNANGLTHDECCVMLLSLPKRSRKFGFMFSYDVTKIVQPLPPVDRYYLMRPNLRDQAICTDCKVVYPSRTTQCARCEGPLRSFTRKVRWKGRAYDYFNGSLSLSQGGRAVKVWDCFRFFGCSFVEALKGWNGEGPDGKSRYDIATQEELDAIFAMKNKRGALEKETVEDVKGYCQLECWKLAKMMRKVIDAHDKAGIPLTRYEGAGSTATALLRANDVSTFKGPRHKDISQANPDLARAMASAFFGGRFEDSMVGIVREPVFGFDISSAYPYALTHLSCLACGKWRYVAKPTLALLQRNPISVANFVVRHVTGDKRRSIAWGPLPCRDRKGSISYGTNFSGWAWAPELTAALEGWPDLVTLSGGAYVYSTRCKHTPFAFLPEGYRTRVAWGKEGAGLALKLGMNASYGKLAQSIGEDPPFQSWTWAGMCTATTRGQLLRAMCTAKDRWNVLTVATDGIYSLEDLPIKAPPRDTGTGDIAVKGVLKPLGGWERKEIGGVFVVKPGLYYKLGAEDLADVRARGVGRREVKNAMAKIEDAFLAWDRSDPDHHVPLESRRFYGAKHSVFGRARCSKCKKSWQGVPEKGCPICGEVGDGFDTTLLQHATGGDAYGRWGVRDVKIGFDPYPKREREGLSRDGTWSRLFLRDLDGIESAPYDVDDPQPTPEGAFARAGKEVQLEQPDWEEDLNAMFNEEG